MQQSKTSWQDALVNVAIPWDADAEKACIGDCLENPEILAEISPNDFFNPAHAAIVRALADMVERGDGIDPITVADKLHGQVPDPTGLVADCLSAGTYGINWSKHAGIVREKALRRKLIDASYALQRTASNGAALEEIERHVVEVTAIQRAFVAESTGKPAFSLQDALDIDAFLADGDGIEYDWIIEGFLERKDRCLLTGREGAGKSFLLEQIAVQAAAGMHPFTNKPMEPLTVALIDFENGERELRRRLRAMRIKAGDQLKPLQLFVFSQPQGVDLNEIEDREWLRQRLAALEPDLVVIGPAYKLANGDPNSEQDMKPVSKFLDEMRTTFNVAFIIEAHIPHDGKGRPFGWSGWRRWPELGLELTETGLLKAWRPSRHETSVPPALQRGGEWPFTPVTRERDVLWARIVNHAASVLGRPSVRDLATELDKGATTVQRAIDEHRAEWESMERPS